MEVSGKISEQSQFTTTFSKGSSEDFDFYCEPCASDGSHVEASGYCKNCQEFLCTTCFASHRRVRLTKNHILLDKSTMPKQQRPATKESECKKKCLQHPKEIIIYFCASDDEVGCHICMSTKHSKCVNEYIPDIADGTKDGSEYRNLLIELDDIEHEAARKESKAKENKDIIDKSYSATLKAICDFRKDINDHLDKMQQSLSTKAQQVKNEEQASLDSVLIDCNDVRNTVSTYNDEMKADALQNAEAFVLMKLYKTEIKENHKKLLDVELIKQMKEPRTFSFQPNRSIRNVTDLGKLEFVHTHLAKPLSKIEVVSRAKDSMDIKSEDDTKDCEVFGIAKLSQDELALADFANCKVKIIDLKQKQCSRTFKVTGKPWDLTVLRNGRIAVAFTDSIEIFCKSFDYQVYKRIKVDGKCRGITSLSSNDKIVATFELPAKVVVLSHEGDVLNTFSGKLGTENTIFKDPEYVAVSPDEKHLYVCDYEKNSVTRLSMTGIVTAVLSGVLHQPRGITVSSDGNLYVCDYPSNKILKISADLSQFEAILTKNNGIYCPLSISLCEKRNYLYVCCQQSPNKILGNELLVFDLGPA